MQGIGGSSRLIVRRGPQPNQVYELNKDIVALGRDITNDIVINDPEVSRHHCRLTRTPTGFTLEDLGSTNGTFVNGQRLTAARPLMNGDMIGLGETVTLVHEGSMVQPPAGPAQAQTMIGATAQPAQYDPYARPAAQPQQPAYVAPQPQPYAPAPQQQPHPQPQPQQEYGMPQYAAPVQPQYGDQAAGYEYYEYEQEQGGSHTGRIIAIGCGCLVVVCVVSVIIMAFVIDALNLWCSVPVVPNLFNLQCPGQLSAVPTLLGLLL